MGPDVESREAGRCAQFALGHAHLSKSVALPQGLHLAPFVALARCEGCASHGNAFGAIHRAWGLTKGRQGQDLSLSAPASQTTSKQFNHFNQQPATSSISHFY